MPTLRDEDDDPIRSYTAAAAQLDIALSTFRRTILPHVPIEVINGRRHGVRQSTIDKIKAGRVRQPARSA